MAHEITVYCDVCGRIGGAGHSLRGVHRELRAEGWVRRHRQWLSREILDVCPVCQADKPGAVDHEINGYDGEET